jgi:probable rRNA maturation factor
MPMKDPDFFSEEEPEILIHIEDVEYQWDEEEPVISWIQKCILEEGKTYQAINFIFCSDAYLHEMNQTYLQHDTLTDVITFPYHESPEEPISGDVFISVERTQDNAVKYKTEERIELYRVMIHGILHLIGYGDKTPIQKKLMTEKEDYYLAKI